MVYSQEALSGSCIRVCVVVKYFSQKGTHGLTLDTAGRTERQVKVPPRISGGSRTCLSLIQCCCVFQLVDTAEFSRQSWSEEVVKAGEFVHCGANVAGKLLRLLNCNSIHSTKAFNQTSYCTCELC